MTTAGKKKLTKWILALTLLYGAFLTALTTLNMIGADRFWFGAFNSYLPQLVWAIPGLLLALFSLKAARRWVWAPLLCLAWVLGPIMGFCWGTQVPERYAVNGSPLRIMTWNVKYGGYNPITQLAIAGEIKGANADLILLQDAGGLLEGPIGHIFRGWNVTSFGQFIIASRFPIEEGGEGSTTLAPGHVTCLRRRLRIGKKSLVLYDVHFQSPRSGLSSFREVRKQPWYLPTAIQELDESIDTRLSEARAVTRLVRQEREAVIVAGDLNSPEASVACAMLKNAGLHDAFNEGGRGYGYTYGHFLLRHRLPWLSASWMRIDHIMLSSQFHSYRCFTGTKDASEHRPVIAEVILEAG